MDGQTSVLKKNFKCKYCQREFQRESTLTVHVCEQKKRYQDQNDPAVRLGFQSYLRFYEVSQGSARTKTYDDFASSPYYRAFVKFGQYCVNSRVINIGQFTEWLLKNNKKLDRWASDQLYTEYLVFYLRVEAATDALTRALETAIDWSEETQHPSQDLLRYGNSNKICHWIVTGRLSAWVLYNSESGQKLLDQLDSTALEIVFEYINPEIWSKKFADYPADTEYVRELLKQAGW